MKKAIIVASKEENITEEKRAEFDAYAKEHDLEIIEQIKYPSIMAILDPDEFVKSMLLSKPDIVLTDDAHFLLADLYHDGKILKALEQKGVQVFNPKSDDELTKVSEFVNKEFKQKIKETVDGSLDQLVNSDDEAETVAIITSDTDSEKIKDAIGELNKSNTVKACVMEMEEFTEEMKDELKLFFEVQKVKTIIIFDSKIMTPLFEEYLNYVENKLGIQVIYAGELKENSVIN